MTMTTPNQSDELELILSEPQSMVFTSTQPLNLDMAGQRAGKSQMIGILAGWYITKYPKMKGFIAANTYLQLTQSTLIKATEIWRDYYQLSLYDRKKNPDGDYVIDRRPPAHFITHEDFKDYNNIISFKNGGMIYVGSLDNYKAHDGKEFCWAHLDETKDTKEEAVTMVILARLSQGGLYINAANEIVYAPGDKSEEIREMRAFNPAWIHTSPAMGQVDWLVKMFQLDTYEQQIRNDIVKPDDFFYKEFDGKSVCIFSTYHNEKNLPANYIEGRIRVLSENEQMKFIFGYPFSKTGGEYYPRFERIKHVRKIERRPSGIRHTTWDFNVMPYMTLLAAQVDYKFRYIDKSGKKFDEPGEGLLPIEVMVIEFYKEYCLVNPFNTTESCCKQFIEDEAGNPTLEIFYYGDASGNNQIPGLGSLTNYKIIQEQWYEHLAEGSKRVKGSNIGVLTRRDLMNRIFEDKIPEVEMYFDEEMKETIRDFEFVKLGVDGKLKEKYKDKATGAVYEKIGHTSDAVEYLACEILKHFITFT